MKSKLAILLMALLLLAGCGMSREEVISAVKACEAAGMRPRLILRMGGDCISEVQCLPLELVHE